jgi:hypothetical protein
LLLPEGSPLSAFSIALLLLPLVLLLLPLLFEDSSAVVVGALVVLLIAVVLEGGVVLTLVGEVFTFWSLFKGEEIRLREPALGCCRSAGEFREGCFVNVGFVEVEGAIIRFKAAAETEEEEDEEEEGEEEEEEEKAEEENEEADKDDEEEEEKEEVVVEKEEEEEREVEEADNDDEDDEELELTESGPIELARWIDNKFKGETERIRREPEEGLLGVVLGLEGTGDWCSEAVLFGGGALADLLAKIDVEGEEEEEAEEVEKMVGDLVNVEAVDEGLDGVDEADDEDDEEEEEEDDDDEPLFSEFDFLFESRAPTTDRDVFRPFNEARFFIRFANSSSCLVRASFILSVTAFRFLSRFLRNFR